MQVLITGGLGFIGCNLALRCLELGWKVAIVDNGKSAMHFARRSLLDRNVEIFDRNMRMFCITSRFDDYDVVFHLAALPSVLYSMEHPYASFKNNVQDSTVIMLQEAAQRNIGRVVFASSAAIYGNNIRPAPYKIDESSVGMPESPYGCQKLMGEQLMSLYSRQFKLDTVSLRYFNVYGPYQYNKGVYATAVSSWLNAIKDRQPLRKDGDGTQTRDLVYVDDIVQANILAATHTGKLGGEVFNVGTGVEISNNQILEALKARFKFEIQQAPARPGDIQRVCANVLKAKTVLGFEAAVSFEQGLDRTIASLGL